MDLACLLSMTELVWFTAEGPVYYPSKRMTPLNTRIQIIRGLTQSPRRQSEHVLQSRNRKQLLNSQKITATVSLGHKHLRATAGNITPTA